MIVLALFFAVVSPLLGGVVAAVSKTPLYARSAGIVAMSVALGASIFSLVAPSDAGSLLGVGLVVDDGSGPALLAFVNAIGLIAVAMNPSRDTNAMTFARILLVNALSAAFVLMRDAIPLAVLWCASVVVVWIDLRSHEETRGTARSFAWYMVPSCGLVVTGAMLQNQGLTAAAVLPLAVGIAVREAVAPFHSWLPSFMERAPMGLVVAFVTPQLGVYAHLRLLSGGLPHHLANVVAATGVVTVLFGAAMGTVQSRARRAMGYLMVSQSALVAFGLETDGSLGRSGAIASWLLCGLAMASMLMVTAALEARRGVLYLDRPNGTFRRIPLLATAYLVLGLASVGLPGTFGFVAEDLLVQGSVERFPVLGLALIIGTGLNSITVVRSFFALFTGTREHAGERDLSLRERTVLTVLIGALLVTGVWPRSVLMHQPLSDNTESRSAEGF